MSSPTIDFRTIRPHQGSQQSGFEELVCQMAVLDTPDRLSFHRKGIGADGGLECYRVEADGSETGWQAKYFFAFGAGEASQLTASFDQAVASHPLLRRFIVCMPFNLPDGRAPGKSSARDRWDRWVQARLAVIAPRVVSIEYWGGFELTERLSRNDPLHVGRRTYWFDMPHFGPGWFRDRFAISRAALGERYTPELNVELPIRKAMAAFARDPAFVDRVGRWADDLDEVRHRAIRFIGTAVGEAMATDVADLEDELTNLAAAIRAEPLGPLEKLPFDRWRAMAATASAVLGRCMAALWAARTQNKHEREAVQSGLHFGDRIYDVLGRVGGELDDPGTRLANQRRLLVTGEAGIGKSHLLADVADHHIAHGLPAIIMLGGAFGDAEPWHQIGEQLGLPGTPPDAILGALDAAAEAAGTRALVIIDAINERNGIAVWADRLASFLTTADRFPHIGILISCRTTFVTYIVGGLDETALPRIAHPGFAGKAADAARRYLDQRGIVRMAAPNFAPEFENPLFLRTCCDMLERRGERSLPRGIAGVSSIFDFYLEAVADTLDRRLRLLPHRKVVQRAISGLTDAMVAAGTGYLPVDQADAILETVHDSQGQADRSLFFQLESEGVIAVEPVQEGASTVEMVRFTFERISDHAIARHLLDTYVRTGDPQAAFVAGGALAGYVGRDAERFAGIAEALSVQLPERHRVELIDLVPDEATRWRLLPAFQRSLRWRRQDRFSERTMELVEDWADGMGYDAYFEILVAIATEPDNPFNADHLDRWLRSLPLPERDELWSVRATYLAEEDDNAIVTLVEWTLANGLDAIDPERARLAGIILAWLTSLSHRWVRDMATKALANLLVDRRPLAAHLIAVFADVDDPYVVERVLAAAYGAATRRSHDEGVAELAQAAYAAVFEREKLTPNALIRDHARGLVELAALRGFLLAGTSLERARPPYPQGLPLEVITDATVAGYVQNYGAHLLRDEICSSAIEDGDFARYEIDPLAGDFLRLPREEFGSSTAEIYEAWHAAAVAPFPERVAAFAPVLALTRRASEMPLDFSIWDRGDPNGSHAARRAAEEEAGVAIAAFEAMLDPEELEAFRLRAASYVRGRMWDETASLWHPTHKGDAARRWVAWRAHQLGWTPERFGEFDRHLPDRGRMEHRIERIGKKYQWIAYHELAGRLADIALMTARFGEDPILYDGPWQLGSREMDPTLLVTRTEQRDSDSNPASWWAPHASRWRAEPPAARRAWMADTTRDMPVVEQQIMVRDHDGRSWLVLDADIGRHQWAMFNGERVIHRTAWHKVKSLLVARKDADCLVAFLEQSASARDHPNEVELPRSGYLGEYPWHPAFAAVSDGWEIGGRNSVQVHGTVVDWYVERSGHDYSVESSFNLTIPAPLLMRGLDLRLAEGRSLAYGAADGRILFKDPSADEPGFSAAVVDQDAFEAFLDRAALDVVWMFTGEKSAHAGGRRNDAWGGMLEYWGLYRLHKGQIRGALRFEHKEPQVWQLKAFFAGD